MFNSCLRLFFPFLFILTFLNNNQLFGQINPGPVQNEKTELIDLTNNFYGSDPMFVNGRKNFEMHYNADGNPYFLSGTFQKGSFCIQGKKADQVDLLYDIYLDKIILRTTINQTDTIFVQLNKLEVDSLRIARYLFINSELYKEILVDPGYYELIFKGNHIVFKKHKKSFIPDYTKNKSAGHFSKPEQKIFLYANGRLINISKRKMFLSSFPENSKEIKQFMRKNKIRYSKADNDILKLLYHHCDEFTTYGK